MKEIESQLSRFDELRPSLSQDIPEILDRVFYALTGSRQKINLAQLHIVLKRYNSEACKRVKFFPTFVLSELTEGCDPRAMLKFALEFDGKLVAVCAKWGTECKQGKFKILLADGCELETTRNPQILAPVSHGMCKACAEFTKTQAREQG